ncbi:MAG: cyclic nucleotide-binding domain-containing protein [Planctomycetes bacterium]|nr:cyclic nucleotide-binding domain-containing protein [Planctomycetota bacterium]
MEDMTIEKLLGSHDFFDGMKAEDLALVAGCGSNVVYQPGELIARQGTAADFFLAIRHGRVAVEIYVPSSGALRLETVSENSVVGWSWLFEPYRWHFDIRALELTRAVRFDGHCLRKKCDDDPVLGYDFMKRFAAVAARRLEAARLQIIDIYGKKDDDPDNQG